MIKLVSEYNDRCEVSQERLKICGGCEYYLKDRDKCEKCGCFMAFKTMVMSASCPIDKWGPKEK